MVCKSLSPKNYGCTLHVGHTGPHQAWNGGSLAADRPYDEWLDVEQDLINHLPYYGGDKPNNPYETIKIIEAWNLDFHLGQVIKYISRAGKKENSPFLEDLRKARWYLNRKIELEEKK